MGSPGGCCGITRRGFLLGAGAGLAAGASLAWLGIKAWDWLHKEIRPSPFTGRTREVKSPALAMPGPFPGRVVEVRHPGAVRPDYSIDPDAVRAMMDHGMCQLTGADGPVEAWKRFFGPGDVV